MQKKKCTRLLIGLVFSVLLLGACERTETATPLPPTPTAVLATATSVPPTTTPEPTATPAPTATPTPLSAEALLQAAFDAQMQASAYRFDLDMLMTLSGPSLDKDIEIPTHFAGDMQPPDRMQGTTTMSINGIDFETPVVRIGDTNYAKNPTTGRWEVGTQPAATFNPEDLVMKASDVKQLQLLGEETLESVPVYHLTGQAKLPFRFFEALAPAEADMYVNYWIDQVDLRLVRSTVEGQITLTDELSATADISMTVRLFDYDVPLEITAPEMAAAATISVPEVGPIPIEVTLLAPLESDTAEGHVGRGLASLADGRFGLALAHFNRALALRPDWHEALLYRGATLAIDGPMDAVMADLDQAIEAEPEWAEAYALRAWAILRILLRGEIESDTALPQARADIAQALALAPDLTAAACLQALTDLLEALDRYELEPEPAISDFETAMADLEAILEENPDTAIGLYLPMLPTLTQLNVEDHAWLARQVDKTSTQIADTPSSYAAYAVRAVANLHISSQSTTDFETLQQAGDDLLYSMALAHRRMSDLADPDGGPLQVARIWDMQEATYTSGVMFSQVFFSQAPQSYPQFAQMLTAYWELHDLFAEYVDDPIVFDVTFNPDGTQIATLSESGPSYMRLWDAVTGEKLHEIELDVDGMVLATTNGNLDYSADGDYLVTAYTNPVVRVIDTQTGEVTLEMTHTTSVHSTAFSPDGKRIVTVDPDSAIPVIWDAETGERVLTVTVGSAVSTVTLSPDGRQIVGGGAQIQMWDAQTGALLTTLPGYESPYVGAPTISPDGKLLAAPGYPARMYDLVEEVELYTLPTGARAVAFSPDGRWIATAGFEAAGVWDAETGDLRFLAGHTAGTDSAAFSPDGRLLVTGGSDGRFRVWDIETGAELWSGMAATLWWEVLE